MEKWSARRGTPGDNNHACPPSSCMILDCAGDDGHLAFGQIVVRMQGRHEDDAPQLKRTAMIVAAPELAALLQEMLDAFVPTIRSQSRLTQAQGSASIHARELLQRLKGDK